MKKITLTNPAQKNTTVLENVFIDRYMAGANGEYVKVYLLLLRQAGDERQTPTVSGIADFLDLTERDVLRALSYWKSVGLLDYDLAETGESMTPTQGMRELFATEQPEESAPDVPNIEQYRSRKEFKELVFVAEQYLCKTLSSTEVDAITYFYETLGMSADLIEYLIEYCVENGHKSIHYIQQVALSWHERGIETVEQAREGSLRYNKNCYSVLNAYGIKGRAPADGELTYIKKWNEEYGFSLEIILEACNRTISAIHQPSFAYTDSILQSWVSHGVQSLSDVSALDAEHLREKERKNRQHTAPAHRTGTRFNNFDSRSYDMDELERKLVKQ